MTLSKHYSLSRPLRIDDVTHWDIETEIAVVGFGVSGACAAIEARLAGATVQIFELAAASGGSSALSGGEFYLGGNGGTPIQRAAGFEDATEDFFNYLMMAGGPNADEARVRCYAEGARDHFDWLVAQGIPFKGTYSPEKCLEPMTDDTLVWSGSENSWPFSQQARPAPRGHAAQLVGMGAGKVIMESLTRRANDLGIIAHYNTRALALIADDANQVHGLVVRIDGEPRMVRASKGVILCAGGFICNEQMVRRYVPAALKCPNPTSGGNDHGAGILMGASVGGATVQMGEFFATRPMFPPDQLLRGILVNAAGQRFINEDAYHGRVTQYMMRQPGDQCWLLVDNACFARPWVFQDISISATGDTWEEVESELGMPQGELVHTVETYNRHAANGEDPLWHKIPTYLRPLTEPPFAALNFSGDAVTGTSFTLGGLWTLPTGQVLTPDKTVIGGLYAAGRTACGLPCWGEGYSSGMSLGDSSFFGRQAGRHAATS